MIPYRFLFHSCDHCWIFIWCLCSNIICNLDCHHPCYPFNFDWIRSWILYYETYNISKKILAGFFFGFVIESFLYIYFFFRFENFVAATTVFWIMLGALVLIGSLAGAFFFPMTFIINTSFVGSYLFFRCIGSFAGGFTNEFVIARERQESRYDQIAWQNYVYIGLTLLMGGIATAIQYRINNLKYYEKNDAEQKGFSHI